MPEAFPFPPKPIPVAITGGTGFIGLNVARRLYREGFREIRLVSRRPQLVAGSEDEKRFKSISCDLSDVEGLKKAFAGCGAVFHVAAKAGVWGRKEDYEKVNVEGTANAVEAAKACRVPYFIYTSTPSVVFNRQAFRGEDETLPYGENFLCPYAETKARAEKSVLEAHQPGAFETIALRPHLVWGPGDPHIVPRLIERAKAGRLRRVGKGTNKVDITYVDNAAQAHVAALGALQAGRGGGEAFFISQGEPVNLWDWIEDLLQRFDIQLPKRPVPLQVAYLAGGLLEGVCQLIPQKPEPPMTRFVAVELAKDHYFSPEKARKILGYQPEVTIEEGLENTVKAFVSDL